MAFLVFTTTPSERVGDIEVEVKDGGFVATAKAGNVNGGKLGKASAIQKETCPYVPAEHDVS